MKKRVPNFDEFTINEGEKIKKKYKVQQEKNEEILKSIYDLGLQYNEGEFKPDTWFRPGKLLNDGQSDKLITNFAGISLAYDLKNYNYTLSLPVKFKKSFVNDIQKLINKSYQVTDRSDNYGSVIIFI